MGAPWWVAAAIFFLAALVQTSLLPALGLVTIRPDLILAIVVLWAVLRGVREALPWAFAGGLILDLFSGAPFGTSSLSLVLVAFCCSVGEVGAFRTNVLLPMMAVFWASLLYSVLYLFLLTPHVPVQWLASLRHIVLPNALVNTAVSPLLYWTLGQLERRTRRTVAVEF